LKSLWVGDRLCRVRVFITIFILNSIYFIILTVRYNYVKKNKCLKERMVSKVRFIFIEKEIIHTFKN
ncbi:unnamed protein product, partial [marine sediment metagenome]